jgi:pyruvate kinase
MLRSLKNKRTKIVATIGPTSQDEETLRKMIRAGLDVARINFSHGSQEGHAEVIKRIRKVAQEEGAVVGVLADLQGPKIRLGKLENDGIDIQPGDQIILTTRENPDQSKRQLPLPHPEFIVDVHAGNRLLLDDGELEMVVRSTTGDALVCEVVVGGLLKSRKGVSSPDAKLSSLSALTEKDRDDAVFALKQGVDFMAMSFVRNADDMRELRWLLRHHGGDVWLIAKIEKFEAIDNFENILKHSDGIMVARGDLGLEIPAAEVPIQQKRIISMCNKVGKPVITATQMLNSMIESPRPTRAEASDVANAIFDGTDAVMLSGETASGKYPVEAVTTMAAIAAISEKNLPYYGKHPERETTRVSRSSGNLTANAISFATKQIADILGAKLLVTSTWTGYTARRVARERPNTPILCVTPNNATFNRMALIWGVLPMMVDEFHTIDEMLRVVVTAAQEAKYVETDDIMVIIAGVPFGAGGHTNFLKVHRVGDDGGFL